MSTIKVNNIQNANGTSAIAIDSSGVATFSKTLVPSSSMMYRNRIINGAMVIDQRNAGASVTQGTGTLYTLDRFACIGSAASKFSIQKSTTAPTGFNNSLLVTSLSAYTVGASERFGVWQIIEGYNIADLGWGTANAKTATLSFVVRSSLTGQFGGVIYSSDRFYPFSYTISSANTWETKTITITGSTNGTWATDNSAGMVVYFNMGAGASQSATAGSWGTSSVRGATGDTSVVGTNGATFYITGVQLEVGDAATPFEHRPYDMELLRCQRYYYNHVTGNGLSICSGFYYTATAIMGTMNFPTTMRVSPTISATSGTDYYKILRNGTSDTFNSIDLQVTNTNCYTLYQSANLSGTVGQGGSIETNNASSFISFNAEL